MRGLETDTVVSGPIRGLDSRLEKNAQRMDITQTHRHMDIMTL